MIIFIIKTCAQTVGIISSIFCLNENSTNLGKLCSIISMFLNENTENCWEVRHSGIMILKYTIATTTAVSTTTSTIFCSENLLENFESENFNIENQNITSKSSVKKHAPEQPSTHLNTLKSSTGKKSTLCTKPQS